MICTVIPQQFQTGSYSKDFLMIKPKRDVPEEAIVVTHTRSKALTVWSNIGRPYEKACVHG